jgi:glycosyltransferase involved in cell wall biosynthesis
VGNRKHQEIPIWQKASDVLVLPNTAKEKISKYYTSPMKLFEYMASHVPIVTSRIPSIEEIVTEEEVFFAEADNEKSVAEKIKMAIINGEEATRRSNGAFAKVLAHTWDKRAKRILSFINKGSL